MRTGAIGGGGQYRSQRHGQLVLCKCCELVDVGFDGDEIPMTSDTLACFDISELEVTTKVTAGDCVGDCWLGRFSSGISGSSEPKLEIISYTSYRTGIPTLGNTCHRFLSFNVFS